MPASLSVGTGRSADIAKCREIDLATQRQFESVGHPEFLASGGIEGMTASDYIRQSIQKPDTFTVPGYGPGIMPALPLTSTEVDTLVGYLLEDRP